MRIVMRRGMGIFAVSAVAGLLSAGCAAGPSQIDAAAIVGDTAISLNSVQQEINVALAHPSAPQLGQNQPSPADQGRNIVTEKVTDQIAQVAAQRDGLHVTDQQVSQYIAQYLNSNDSDQSTDTNTPATQEMARSQLFQAEYAQAQLDKLELNFDVALVPSRQQATELANKLAADPAHSQTIISAATGPTGEADFGRQMTGSDVVKWQIQLNQQEEEEGGSPVSVLPLLGAKANSVLAFQFDANQTEWMVALVHSSDMNAPAPAQGSSVIGQLATSDLAVVGDYLLSSLGQQLGVRISPRYGVWDPLDMEVVASSAETLGVEIPATTS